MSDTFTLCPPPLDHSSVPYNMSYTLDTLAKANTCMGMFKNLEWDKLFWCGQELHSMEVWDANCIVSFLVNQHCLKQIRMLYTSSEFNTKSSGNASWKQEKREQMLILNHPQFSQPSIASMWIAHFWYTIIIRGRHITQGNKFLAFSQGLIGHNSAVCTYYQLPPNVFGLHTGEVTASVSILWSNTEQMLPMANVDLWVQSNMCMWPQQCTL